MKRARLSLWLQPQPQIQPYASHSPHAVPTAA